MIHTYARSILVLAAALLVAMLVPAPAVAEDTCDDDTEERITIDVAPTTINLQHFGMWLTIHTDILYESVDSAEVYFNLNEDTKENDAFTCWKKTDDLGYFVAKCDIREINQIGGDIGKDNTFTLKGEHKDGREFCGEQKVMIIDKGPESSAPGKGVK